MSIIFLNSTKFAFSDNSRFVIALTKEEIKQRISEVGQQISAISKQVEDPNIPNREELLSERELLRERRKQLIDLGETRHILPDLTPPAGKIEKMYKRFSPDQAESMGLLSPDKLLESIKFILKDIPTNRNDIINELNEISTYLNLIKEELIQTISEIQGKYSDILNKYSTRINQIIQEFTPQGKEEVLDSETGEPVAVA